MVLKQPDTVDSMMHDTGAALRHARSDAVIAALANRSIVLTGMMGAGKSSIGRRLALALGLPFFDADLEIERAAGKSIEDIFSQHGEGQFRDGEERVIRRLLHSGQQVLATGGGAMMSAPTRAEVRRSALSVWLNAPLDVLLQRVSRRDNRPLLKTGDPGAVMSRLLSERLPYYAAADVVFDSRDAPHEVVVHELLTAIEAKLERQRGGDLP